MVELQDRQNPEAEPPLTNKRKIITFVIALLAFTAWLFVLNLLFLHYAKVSYLKWFLKNGGLISAVTGFVALVSKKIGEQKDLLSWHPLVFLRSCAILAAMFFSEMAANLAVPRDRVNHRDDDSVSAVVVLWDAAFTLILNLLMAIALLAWFFVIAPGFYALTLFTGAPARSEIRGTGRRVVVEVEGLGTTITDQPASLPIPSGAIDISFGTQPFALTNALNAAVIFLAQMLIRGAR